MIREETARTSPNGSFWRKHFYTREGLLRVLTLVVTVLTIAAVIIFRKQLTNVESFSSYGYLGILLINIAGSAATIVPLPATAVVIASSVLLNPLLVGLFAGVGQGIGAITGYMLGYSGQGIVRNGKSYTKMQNWMRRRGGLAIFVLAVIPDPLFKIAGVAAGALRYPLWKFIILVLVGETLKNIGYAYAGALGIQFISRLFG